MATRPALPGELPEGYAPLEHWAIDLTEGYIVYVGPYDVDLARAWDEGHNHCFHVEKPNAEGNPYR